VEVTAPGSAGASSRLVNGVVALGALGVAGLAFYETPERYDRLPRGRVDAISRPVARLENAGRLMQGDRGTR
jgi:hypothetical protein